MAAYLIVDIEITDPAGFAEYRQAVVPTLLPYGGRYLVRGGAHETVEGDWRPRRLVMLEFPSMAHAKRWYDSEEYRAPKALRFRCARTNVVLVEGI